MRPSVRIGVLFIVALALALLGSHPTTAAAGGLRFQAKPPIWEIDDTAPIDEPQVRDWNRYHSYIDGYWLRPLDDILGLHAGHPALDINSVEGVPASSWFTPRVGHLDLSAADVGRGAVSHPALTERDTYSVLAARIDGPEPFLLIAEDEKRQCRLILDDPAYPEMRTAATVIAGRLLHACGYNVFESFIDHIRPEQLVLAEDAEERERYGGTGDLDQKELDALIARLAPEGGRLRVAVCRLPEGTPKGGFPDRGVRGDDPNDQIPHQDRRSLRGLRVFSSWIGLTRMRTDRTLDVYLDDGRYLRHYLYRLGMSLGARVQSPHPFGTESEESYWAMGVWLGNLFQFGFGKSYQTHPPAARFPGVGEFAARGFDPVSWAPAYRYEPFARMAWGDAFWAADIVSSFTSEQIGAAVAAGKLSDPQAEAYLRGTLIERRDRLAAGWFAEINAACDFEILRPSQNRWLLSFDDRGVTAGAMLPEDTQYVMAFSLPELNELLGEQARGGHYLEFDLSHFVPPPHLHRNDPRRYGVASLRAYSYLGRLRSGACHVHLYFDPETGPRVIGIERD